MATSKVGELHVEINAKLEKLEQALGKAEKMVQRSTRKIDKAAGDVTGGISGAFAAIGKSGAKVIAVLATIEALMGGIRAGTHAFFGEWEKVAGALKELPIVGSVIQRMESAVEQLQRFKLPTSAPSWLKSVLGFAGMGKGLETRENLAESNRKTEQQVARIQKGMALVAQIKKGIQDVTLTDKERAFAALESQVRGLKHSAAGLPGGELIHKMIKQFETASMAKITRDFEEKKIKEEGGSGLALKGFRVAREKKEDKKVTLLEAIEENTRGGAIAAG